MSAAVAADAVEVPVKKKRSKKLVLILAVVGVLLAGGGGAAVFVMKKKAAEAAAAAEEGGEEAEHASADGDKPKKGAGHVPTFLPLDPFVVNLADRETERYAQIGVTLQVDDAQVAEQLKAYMPAIRNGVLMILAHKSSAELLEREGKLRLAAEIMREAVRPLGIELDAAEGEPATAAPAAAADDDKPVAAKKQPKKKKKSQPAVHNPVEQVHFSSFIIQ